MTRFSKLEQWQLSVTFQQLQNLMMGRLFRQNCLRICHMWLRICKKTCTLQNNWIKISLPVGYRMIECDSIPVQQTTNFAWRHNPSIFDHCNLTNMFVMLNSRRYLRLITTERTFLSKSFQGFMEMPPLFEQSFTMLKSWFLLQYNPGRLQGIVPNVCLWSFKAKQETEKLGDWHSNKGSVLSKRSSKHRSFRHCQQW